MRWGAVLSFIEKDLKQTFRSPDVVFWVIVFPVLILSIFIPIFAPVKQITLEVKVAAVVLDHGDYAKKLVEVIRNASSETLKISVVEYSSIEAALNKLKRGKVDAVLVIPEGFSKNLSETVAKIEVYMNPRKEKSQMSASILQGIIEEAFATSIKYERLAALAVEIAPQNFQAVYNKIIEASEPLSVEVKEVKEMGIDPYILRGFFIMTVIAMAALFDGVYSGALAFVEEKDYGTLRRVLSTPISPWELLIGKTLSGIILVFIASVLSVAWAVTVFKAKLTIADPVNIALAVLLIVLSTLLSTGLGLIISLFGKTAKGVSSIAWTICFILMFFSGIMIPAWMLPKPLQAFAYNFPLTEAMYAIGSIIVLNTIPDNFVTVLAKVAVSTIVVYTVGALLCRRRLEKLIVG